MSVLRSRVSAALLFLAVPSVVNAATTVEAFKNRYFLACTREATSGPDAVSFDLAAAMCSCSSNRIAASFTLPELQAIDADVSAHYEEIMPIIKRCATEAVEKLLSEPD